MSSKSMETINAGCTYKEVIQLEMMKESKKSPLRIKFKELSLLMAAKYRLRVEARGKRKGA